MKNNAEKHRIIRMILGQSADMAAGGPGASHSGDSIKPDGAVSGGHSPFILTARWLDCVSYVT